MSMNFQLVLVQGKGSILLLVGKETQKTRVQITSKAGVLNVTSNDSKASLLLSVTYPA